MKRVIRFCFSGCLAFVVLIVFGGIASAQSYPARPIRIIVPFPPGGGVDTVTRMISLKMTETFAQPIVIDARPGAGGDIGTEMVAKATPDGYTLLATFSSLASNAALYTRPGFDAVKSFAPIALLITVPNLLFTNPALPAKTVKELIALAKKRPNEIRYASIGVGTPPHLTAELFNSMAGIKMTHVPYRGGPPSVLAVISGEVDLSFTTVVVSLPHITAGKLRAIAVTTLKRFGMIPEVPTVDESGLAGFDSTAWYALLAPAKTPQPIIDILNRETVRALELPDIREGLIRQGAEPAGGAPSQLGAVIKADIDKWSRVVKTAKIKVD